jgi:hypothetical protein
MQILRDMKNLFWPSKRRRRTLAQIKASARKGYAIVGEEFERLLADAKRHERGGR